MTEKQKKMKRYINAIERRLNLPRGVKARVMSDLSSSIQGRREAGKTDEEIYAELGTPEKVAADLNEQMKEFAFTRSPWRWACLALAALGLVLMLVRLLMPYLLVHSAGIIGGADGPTAIFITTGGVVFPWHALLWLIPVVLGLFGFWRLSRCKRK